MVNTKINQTNQSYTQYRRAVGVFKRREDLESALQALKGAGVEKERISLLARHMEDVKGADEITEGQGNEASEGAGIGATTGTVLGGVGGFLVGAGILAIPGVGPVLAAGVGISEIAATLAGAGIGAATGGLVGALVGAGIPEERAKVYDQRIQAGDYLLMVDGTEADLRNVESILRDRNVEEFDIYNAPDSVQQTASTTTSTTATTGRTTAGRKVTDTREVGNTDPEVYVVDKRTETSQRDQIR